MLKKRVKIIKIIIYLLISITLFCETKEELNKIFILKKGELYNHEELLGNTGSQANLMEKKFILRKLIVEKDVANLKYIKILDNYFFTKNFIDSLVRFDDLELYNFYKEEKFFKEENFFEEESLDKFFLLENLIKLNCVNIFSYIIEKNDEEVKNIYLERVFSLDKEDIFEAILQKKKENKEILDMSFLKNQNVYSKKCLEKLFKYPYKDKNDNSLIFYYMNIGKKDEAKEQIMKNGLSEFDYEELKYIIEFFLEKDDEFVNTIINELNIKTFNLSEYCTVNQEKLVAHMIIYNNLKIKRILIDDGCNLDEEIKEILLNKIRYYENDKLETMLKSTYEINFKERNYEDENWLINETLSNNDFQVLKLLKKYGKLNKIQFTVENFAKIVKMENIDMLNFVVDNNLVSDIFSEDENFFNRYYKNNTQISRYEKLLDDIRIDGIRFLDKNLKESKSKDIFKKNMFKIALMKENIETAQYILEKGIDVNEKDSFGKSPIYYFIINKTKKEYYDYLRTIDFMIENGADLNKVDGDKSALMIDQDIELLEKMIEKGIDVGYRDRNGYTAYDYALQSKNMEFINNYNEIVRGGSESE
jgi:hypothetical protein